VEVAWARGAGHVLAGHPAKCECQDPLSAWRGDCLGTAVRLLTIDPNMSRPIIHQRKPLIFTEANLIAAKDDGSPLCEQFRNG
jgi:hypothetical protein